MSKAKDKQGDVRIKTFIKDRFQMKNVFDKTPKGYPSNITKCPKCGSKLPFVKFTKWDNELAKKWVFEEKFLERYAKWDKVNVCDECAYAMLQGCELNRASGRGFGEVMGLKSGYHRRVLR